MRVLARERIRTIYGAFGAFTLSRLALFTIGRVRQGTPKPLQPAGRKSFLLSHVELATLFHPASADVQTDNVARTLFRELPAPVSLPSGEGEGAVQLGEACYRGNAIRCGIGAVDRRRHLYVVGRTGVGKTSLLLNLIRSDIEHGQGVCVIDPHGDLAEQVVASIPSSRTGDVVVLDPADPLFAISFNPLGKRPGFEDLTASGVVSAFKKLYDSWGPRLEDTLRAALYLAIEHDGTLLSLFTLLTDDAERQHCLANTADPLITNFWTKEFASWSSTYRTEALAAIKNKIRPFLMNQNMRAVIGQGAKSIDLREIMDSGKVLIVNLSKGRLGEDNAALLGALLVSKLQIDAMTRADIPEENRRDFTVYVDEFQNFTTEAFATILSEARKFRLRLVCSHQYLGQIESDKTRDAVFGNVGSMVAFQVGIDDAEDIARQLSKYPGQVRPEDLTNLPKYTAYARLLIDGMPEQPFSMQTIPPVKVTEDRTATVRRASNDRYAASKEVVLARLQHELRWGRGQPAAPPRVAGDPKPALIRSGA